MGAQLCLPAACSRGSSHALPGQQALLKLRLCLLLLLLLLILLSKALLKQAAAPCHGRGRGERKQTGSVSVSAPACVQDCQCLTQAPEDTPGCKQSHSGGRQGEQLSHTFPHRWVMMNAAGCLALSTLCLLVLQVTCQHWRGREPYLIVDSFRMQLFNVATAVLYEVVTPPSVAPRVRDIL